MSLLYSRKAERMTLSAGMAGLVGAEPTGVPASGPGVSAVGSQTKLAVDTVPSFPAQRRVNTHTLREDHSCPCFICCAVYSVGGPKIKIFMKPVYTMYK